MRKPRGGKNGRPPFAITPARKARVVELLSCGHSQVAIATELGCSTDTLSRHFREEIETGHMVGRARANALLWKAAKKLNVTAIKLLLEQTAAASAAEAFNGAEPRSPEKRPKLGKKEIAHQAAQAAAEGGAEGWGDDLMVPSASQH